MKTIIAKAIVIVVLIASTTPFATAEDWNPPATYPANFDYWVLWADNHFLPTGQNSSAMGYYSEAYRLAAKQNDAQRIALISDRYLRVGPPIDAVNAFNEACRMALKYAESQNAKERAYGLASLQFNVNLYNNTLRFLPNSGGIAKLAQQASDNLNQIRSQPIPPKSLPRTNVVGGIPAVAKKNGLEGNKPTRGFGDSNEVNKWVPFSFSFGVPGKIAYAKLKYRFKPIGDWVTTDTLSARGASKRVHILYDKYNMLPGNKWYDHTVLIKDPDLIAELQKGTLDCMLQDDTALLKAELEIYYRFEQ